jgi:hypothetical protein
MRLSSEISKENLGGEAVCSRIFITEAAPNRVKHRKALRVKPKLHFQECRGVRNMGNLPKEAGKKKQGQQKGIGVWAPISHKGSASEGLRNPHFITMCPICRTWSLRN